MSAYDTSLKPPAPIAAVTVAHPLRTEAAEALPGKLDTGADVTVIPERLVPQLGLTAKGRVWTRGFDGAYSRRSVFYVRLTVEAAVLPAVRCVAADRANVLLGRNVLNRFLLVLDGPRLTWTLQLPPDEEHGSTDAR